jgi:hypothetical protein
MQAGSQLWLLAERDIYPQKMPIFSEKIKGCGKTDV